MMSRYCIAIILSMISCVIVPETVRAQALDGLWEAQSGTVYRIISKGASIVGTYEIPNSAQTAAGIKKDDLALKGNYIDNVVVGVYYQRAPLIIQEKCPEYKVIDSPIQWELSNSEVTGSLLIIRGTNDSCEVTGRRLQQMRLSRVRHEIVASPAAEGMPLPWPFPW